MMIAAITGLGLAIAACDNTPTVPVPPPEFCAAAVPDADGLCEVSCDSSSTMRDIALVFNDDMGRGVMQETEEDGSFAVLIEATEGNEIIVQMKQDNHLSAEVFLTVPAE